MEQGDAPLAAAIRLGPWDGAKRAIRVRMVSVGSLLGATGVSPNTLTLIGLALNIVAAAIVVAGNFLIGGIAFLVANGFDMLDGAVARATGKNSRFGAFLDSVIDRYNESAIFVGLLIVASQRGDTALVGGTAVALVGSLLVSYARARAEGIGLDCEVGWMQRPERVLVLAAGLLLAPILLAPVVWLLAIVTNITAVQRIVHVRRLLQSENPAGPPTV